MNPWRDAAEEAGILRHFETGLAEFSVPYKPQVAPSEDWETAYRAYQAGVAFGWACVRFDGEVSTTRLDVALAALKRVERNGVDSFGAECCPCCSGKPTAPRRRHIGVGGSVLVTRSIAHAPNCQLARALYGEWP